MRTRSSVGLERHTTDVEVIGSNPFESAILSPLPNKKSPVSESDTGLFLFEAIGVSGLERVRSAESGLRCEHCSRRGLSRTMREKTNVGGRGALSRRRKARWTNPFESAIIDFNLFLAKPLNKSYSYKVRLVFLHENYEFIFYVYSSQTNWKTRSHFL
jgi:hypothetical protein